MKGGTILVFLRKMFQIGLRVNFVKKKKIREKLNFLGVTMCFASVNYPKYFCSPMKNELFFLKVKAKSDLKHFSRQNEYRNPLFLLQIRMSK